MPGFRIFRKSSDSFLLLIHDLDLVARFYLILSNSLMTQVVSQCCLLLPACSFILCPHYGRRCAVPSITLLWVSSNAALNKTIGTNFIFQFLKNEIEKRSGNLSIFFAYYLRIISKKENHDIY